MIVLLDIDGVMVTTAPWQKVEILPDGFMKFNEQAVKNLVFLLKETNATVVLSSTHRITYNEDIWKDIFAHRGINIQFFSKLNDKISLHQLEGRGMEIKEWYERTGHKENFVIIDDDLSIHDLPENIKMRWVPIKPLIGFNNEAMEKALSLLKDDRRE